MRPVLFLVALLIAVPSSAEIFVGRDGFHFSLTRAVVTVPEKSELTVTAQGVVAPPFGVKRASRDGELERREVAVLGEPYDLIDAAGGRWRMWIRTAVGKTVVVELIRARRPGPLERQSFHAASIAINGQTATPSFPPLTLNPNGTYQLGDSRGRYVRDEGGVTLDRAPSHWGRGAFTLDHDGITFRFNRGGFQFEVRYDVNPNSGRSHLNRC